MHLMIKSKMTAPTLRSDRLFGPIAPGLGWVPPIRYLLRRRRILRLLRTIPAGSLLEVGCGSGALLHELAKAGHDATGLESSKPALAMSEAIRLAGQGTQRLREKPEPSWRKQFDLICAFDVLEHIADDGRALDEWLSWLRPGGRICLSVPAHSNRWGAGDEWAGHFRRYDRKALENLFNSRGLTIEHFECYGFPLANLTERLGNRVYRRLLEERNHNYEKDRATSLSGVDRHEYVRLFKRMDTVFGRAALRIAMTIQAITSQTDWGSGFLLLAKSV